MKGAEILTKFTADDSQLNKTINGISKKFSTIGSTMFAGFTAGVVALTGAVGTMLKTSVSAYAEMEQLSGGAQKIFDEIDYKEIEKDAVNAYKNMNMSAREYLSVINTVGANFASTLGDEKGYQVAKEGLQTISDFATGTGLDINKLSSSFQTISKSTQSYQRVSAQFAGILPTTSEAFLKQAQEAGYLAKRYKKLTEVPVAEYQETLVKMMRKGTKEIGLQDNTLKESTETLSGSILAFKSAWDNFLSGVGDTKQVVETAVTALKQIGKGIAQMLPTVTTGIVDLLNELIPSIPPLVNSLFPSVLEGAISIFKGLIDQLPTFISMLGSMLPDIINSLIEGFTDVVNALAEQAPELLPVVVDAIIEAILTLTDPENMDKLIECGGKLMAGIIEGLIKSIPKLVERAPEITDALSRTLNIHAPKLTISGFNLGEKIGKGLREKLPEFIEIGKNIVKGIVKGILSMKDYAYEMGSKIGKGILKSMKKTLGINSPSTEFALIGHYSGEGYIEGLEDMQKDIDKTINATFNPFENSTLGSMEASTPTTNITIQNSMQFDALGQLVNNVKTFSGGAKNDYNYVGGY